MAAGNFGLSPAQIQAMDPQGIGVSTSVMIPYLNSFPLPNDPSRGDGVNYEGFRFKGPVAIDSNWYIARLDYKITSNGNHSLFWRGALRNDFNNGVPYLPGQESPNFEGRLQQGFFRRLFRGTAVQSSEQLPLGLYTAEFWPESVTITAAVHSVSGSQRQQHHEQFELCVHNNSNYQVPVHNFVDDISWIKGKHTLQFGGKSQLSAQSPIQQPQLVQHGGNQCFVVCSARAWRTKVAHLIR